MRLPGTGLFLLVLAGCAMVPPGTLRDTDHPLAGRLWSVADRAFISEGELLRRAVHADALLLGETHDNPEHHRLQAKILETRLASGARPALLMEQFDVDQQHALDQTRRAGESVAPLMRGWDWPMYQPLVTLANAAGIPLVAANLPRGASRPIVREGYSTLPAGEVQRLALEPVWDEARQKYMTRVIDQSHCGKITPVLRDGLIRAQRLRDAILADAALGKLDSGVIFILGRGHARRDVGVPLYLEARRPGKQILTVGFVEVAVGSTQPGQYEDEQVGGIAPFDIIWFTPRAERPDPCLAFGKEAKPAAAPQ